MIERGIMSIKRQANLISGILEKEVGLGWVLRQVQCVLNQSISGGQERPPYATKPDEL
jgi:hypothetical protein